MHQCYINYKLTKEENWEIFITNRAWLSWRWKLFDFFAYTLCTILTLQTLNLRNGWLSFRVSPTSPPLPEPLISLITNNLNFCYKVLIYLAMVSIEETGYHCKALYRPCAPLKWKIFFFCWNIFWFLMSFSMMEANQCTFVANESWVRYVINYHFFRKEKKTIKHFSLHFWFWTLVASDDNIFIPMGHGYWIFLTS